MAKGRLDHQRSKQKKLQRKRRREQKQSRNPAPLAHRPPSELTVALNEAYELIDSRDYAQAEQLLTSLSEWHPGSPALVEAQLSLYLATKNHEGAREASGRLARLAPNHPDARLIYAQESMLSGQFAIALANYRLFLERWPDHAQAKAAQDAAALLEPECRVALRDMGVGEEDLGPLILHDESLVCLHLGEFREAAEKCLKLLQLVPGFTSARNNLALAYFHSGKTARAVEVAEETCRGAPDNRYAEALLGKLRFLGGHEAEAHAIADRLVATPPAQPDPLAAAMELLSFLGRDTDVLALFRTVDDLNSIDRRGQANLLHYLAVAQCRLNDEKAARASWRRALRAMPGHGEARENLADLDARTGHAPWPASLTNWIPRGVLLQIASDKRLRSPTGRLPLSESYPSIAAMIPALLDRGDPAGREFAVETALADGSPALLQALERFALGSRGPDGMRLEVLNSLCQNNQVTNGPHRFYSRGEWITVKLFSAEVTWEPRPGSARTKDLAEVGSAALQRGDFKLAEDTFNQILELEPDNRSAAYNLTVVWMQRDGRLGMRRAKACLEQMLQQHPDYLFAPIALAQLAAAEGDCKRAGELLEPISDARRLHGSEALALFTAQVHIAVKLRDLTAAEQAYSMFVQVAEDNDPRAAQLRQLIDKAARPAKRSRLLPWGW
ncbi:MAG: tetratricopeptide repeat protein [Pirellulaceae bacterium]|nr:tetratricopeptide repeat protein [Pirellulaceae bacterium]